MPSTTDGPRPDAVHGESMIAHAARTSVLARLGEVVTDLKQGMLQALARGAGGIIGQIPRGPESLTRVALYAQPFTPECVIEAYQLGFVPVTNAEGRIQWLDFDPRGVIPIADFHIAREIRRVCRKGTFHVTVNQDFRGVIQGCAEGKSRRARNGDASWVTPEIVDVYTALHRMGAAHSVEVWQGERLVGGTYGVSIGAYFCGESQFYLVSNAGKVALAYLCHILKTGGYLLHDAQMVTPYLQSFGCHGISRTEFRTQRIRAQLGSARFEMTELAPDDTLECKTRSRSGARDHLAPIMGSKPLRAAPGAHPAVA